jgi:hypothetical protein
MSVRLRRAAGAKSALWGLLHPSKVQSMRFGRGAFFGLSCLGLSLPLACGGASATDDDAGIDDATATDTDSDSDDGEESDTGDDGPKLDVGPKDMGGGPGPTCKVVDDMDAVGDCGQEAPADSFDPEVQWSWGGTNTGIIVTPIVANLTDDNDDGEIDLCDIPDVIVVTEGLGGTIHVLDGETGTEHFAINTPVQSFVTPAVADIDNDGIPEIISANSQGRVVAFEHDGSLKFTGAGSFTAIQGSSVAVADIDADGFAEIIVDGLVSNTNGGMMWQAPEQEGWFVAQKNTAPVAADLDDDGEMEVILGQSAYRADGSVYYDDKSIKPGYPQVADLDDDGLPEILINNWDGITVLEHDGTTKQKDARPTGDPVGTGYWFRPSTIHDFDGDDDSEFAVSSAGNYSVFETNLGVNWSAPVDDVSGWAAGTAFDFLGDGEAEAMYADEEVFWVLAGHTGNAVLQWPRTSKTLVEYPIVVDVDNDGSSEVIVVSGVPFEGPQTSDAVQVIRDKEDRWIQARRIWNQHTYHVTNVREDSTIPQHEPHHWELLNTFRTNAQIEDGAVCKPPPEG